MNPERLKMSIRQPFHALELKPDSIANSPSGAFHAFCDEYGKRQNALNLIKLLHQLAKTVQRHRGMSMALLAGSTFFEGDFKKLQLEMEMRLKLLEVFAAKAGELLTDRDRENLHSAWMTVCADWQDDDVVDNFEFHSHFIEQLHAMVTRLAKNLENPISVVVSEQFDTSFAGEPGPDYPQVFKHIELLNFLSRELPAMVEQIARIRGLSTYAAAKGHCDPHLANKLRFAISCGREQNEKIRPQAKRLQDIIAELTQPLSSIKEYELKLLFLLEMVERDVLSGSIISASSHQLFKLATDIIDVYLDVVEHGWSLMQKWQEDDMEQWLASSGAK